MEEIKNKIITRENIKEMAYMLNNRYIEHKKLYQQFNQESQDYNNPNNNIAREIVMTSKPTFEISITTGSQTETKDDIDWLVSSLDRNSQNIQKITISFNSYYKRHTSVSECYSADSSEESVYLSFTPDWSYIKFDYKNPHQNLLHIKESIKSIVNNAPVSYDKIISNKSSRLNMPSLANSLIIGLIITIGLYIFCKVSDINIYINELVLTKYYAPVMLVLSLLLGVIIQGENHALYKALKIKKKYSGYDSTTHTDFYTTDVKHFTDNCETEIGENYNHCELRTKIEKNYRKSKTLVLIELIIFAIFIAAVMLF